MRQITRVAVVALTLAFAGVLVGLAAADPTGSMKSAPITVTCGSTTYYGVVNGNGNWGPAHDLNSNSVLIPVAFGPETDVFTDPNGNQFTNVVPARAKGSSAPMGQQLIDCSYQVGPVTLPDGSMFQVNGTVTGFVTPG